eukprot:CAMPEP_0181237658 /NCGR_PEP_ID=MMETSP1096-20121128/38889_1 /TAXON_ID=156174 ORGANISM="Chrysochromulina ericina, Strain CCMP281" /NCGR_SAMPLE_ID=MMETSP1096 /ASSEMBLY_ACC=CAM_ASM_000453 /LENGTH=132 /DNA_ID=CAMNT_0023333045 /DNA_START=167 /DNA_END=561 /DNA_ORIENTATION=-
MLRGLVAGGCAGRAEATPLLSALSCMRLRLTDDLLTYATSRAQAFPPPVRCNYRSLAESAPLLAPSRGGACGVEVEVAIVTGWAIDPAARRVGHIVLRAQGEPWLLQSGRCGSFALRGGEEWRVAARARVRL